MLAKLKAARKRAVRIRPTNMIGVHAITNDYHVPVDPVFINILSLPLLTVGHIFEIKTK
jgi:hypothetical protein